MNPFSPFNSVQSNVIVEATLIRIFISYVVVSLGLPLPLALLALVPPHFIAGVLSNLPCVCPNLYQWFSLILYAIEQILPSQKVVHNELSFLVLLQIQLNICISATLILLTCSFLVMQHPVPWCNTGLIALTVVIFTSPISQYTTFQSYTYHLTLHPSWSNPFQPQWRYCQTNQ